MRRFPLFNPLIAILLLIGACSPLLYSEYLQDDTTLEHTSRHLEPTHDPTRAGDVVINEFMPDPASDWDGSGDIDWGDDEWIELYNRGAAQVDISGWTLDDIVDAGTSPYTIPGSTTIDPGQHLVFYGSDTGVGLNNAGDWVNLRDTGDQPMDAKSFDHSSDDVSYARIPDGASNWEEVVAPTPGTANQEEDLELGVTLVTDAEYPIQAKDMVDKAKNYVYVLQYEALYYPSHPEYELSELYQSIIDADGRGLEVKVLFDDTVTENQNTKTYLSGNGVNVKIDGPALKLHSKLVIADNRVLLGSTNWGRKSTHDNHETNLRINSTPVGTFFKDLFTDLWADQTTIPTVTPVDTTEIETVITDQYYGNAVEIIDSAQDRIDLIMYHITEVTQTDTLIQKLIDAHGRGVMVRVILDKSGYIDFVDADNMVAMEKLRNGGIPCVFDVTSLNTHAKMLVSDDSTLIGSTNWAYSSLNSQLNTNVLVKNASIAASANDYFDQLWAFYGTTTGTVEISGGGGLNELDFYKGDTVTVTVTDRDVNLNESAVEVLDVDILSDSDSTGISVTLTETGGDSGVFENTFILDSASDQGAGKIKCVGGDLITVRYHDMMDENATSSNIESTFTVLQNAGAITLLEPADEEVILGDSVWLNWSVEYTGDAALTYDLMVDTIPDPVQFAARSVTGNSYFVEDLEDGETFYWKVIPLLDGNTASWESSVRSFDVLFEGVVTLLVPEDETMVQDYSVKLDWDWDYYGSQDVTFDVYLGLSEASLDILVSGIRGTSAYAWDLDDGKTYYWEVVPLLNGIAQSTTSGKWSFAVEFPGSIDLVSPLDAGTVESSEAVLVWDFSYNGTGVLEFNVFLDKKKEPDTLVASAVNTNSTLVKDLEDARKYYWKVIPVVNGNEREWCSSVFSLTTRFSGLVEIKSPENNAEIDALEVLLEWKLDYSGSGVITFSVFMDEKTEPEKKILSRSPRTNHTEDNLIRGNTYYWYVQPYLDGEEVSWRSEIRNFTVRAEGNGQGDDDNGKEDNDDDTGSKDGGEGKGDSSKGGRTVMILIVTISVGLLLLTVIILLVILKRRKGGEEQEETIEYQGQNTFTSAPVTPQSSYPPQVQSPQYPVDQNQATLLQDQFFRERPPEEYR